MVFNQGSCCPPSGLGLLPPSLLRSVQGATAPRCLLSPNGLCITKVLADASLSYLSSIVLFPSGIIDCSFFGAFTQELRALYPYTKVSLRARRILFVYEGCMLFILSHTFLWIGLFPSGDARYAYRGTCSLSKFCVCQRV